jgi:tetratricopeptide (TPR) repeat protein
VSQDIPLDALRGMWQERRLEDGWSFYLSGSGSGAEWHLYGGLFAWARRAVHKAKQILEPLLKDDLPLLLRQRIRYALAVVYREVGDTSLAKELLEDLLRERGMPPEMEALVYYELGLVLHQRRAVEQAADAERRAIEILRPLGYRSYLLSALQNRAWTLCILGQHREARTHLQEAESLLDGGDATWVQRLGWCHLALAERDLDKCVELAQEIIQGATRDAIPGHVLSRAAWLCGRAKLYQGDIASARMLAEAAQQWGLAANDIRCINDGISLMRECVEELGA